MENTEAALAADESLDSATQSIYEALEEDQPEVEEEIINNNTDPTLTMETDNNQHNDSLIEEEDDGEDDGDNDDDDDVEKEINNFNTLTTTPDNISNNNDIEEAEDDDEEELCQNFGEDDEEEEDISEQIIQDESHSFVEHVIPDKHEPLIVQDGDGMIKTIKIYNNKDLNKMDLEQQKTVKTKDTNKSSAQPSSQPRSSTPMSREYLALQRSVNESKILTEFVTDTANEKPRKLRTKDSHNSSIASTTDHSYSSRRKSNNSNIQSSPEKAGFSGDNEHTSNNSISPLSQAKRQYSKRYAPLKYHDSDIDTSNLRPRSRSKSMHNSEFALMSSGGSSSSKKLKKWPSEERLHKRTNMRSENSEFVQKQMEFLQRLRCETPRSRTRSRSRSGGRSRSSGRRTPTQETGAAEEFGNVSAEKHQKSHKTGASKERTSKRIKHETGLDNDEQHFSQVSQMDTMEQHPDDVSVNESNTSILGVSANVDTADADTLDAQLKTVWQSPPKHGYDSFCWKCHETKVNLCCSKCVRTFHAACAKMYKLENTWVCPECATVDNLLNNPKRSRRSELSLDLLSQLLAFALKRMRYVKGHYNFQMPYEESTIYKKYIVNPITLNTLQTKIEMKEYRCAEELVNETKWMLHNAYILGGGSNTKTVIAAKAIFKICRQEANEIETCAECYLNANTRTDWFVDVCSQPHLLLWAKLKGFPYWPAKAMGLGQNSLVNVRFFGEHDRAFVPLKDCYLYSEQDPNTATGKRAAKELADCIKEVQEHIEKIRVKVGAFKYANYKTPYEPADEMKQLEEMMPGVQEFIKKQQVLNVKPSLQFKIYKTADNNLSIVQKASTTPELQPPSTTSPLDIEDKKKKSSLSEEDSKYEVVSKVNSDDSNSSKLSTVILKRKSVNGDAKKLAEDDAVDLPLPKMTKLEDHLASDSEAAKLHIKRKAEAQLLEKAKAKHAKAEPKIPVITIKTTITKDTATEGSKTSLEVATKDVTETSPVKQTHVVATPINEGTETLLTQKVVGSLVKNKQGITIKKIFKDVATTEGSPEQNKTNNNTKDSPTTSRTKETSDDKVAKQKAEEEKARENQKVNSILKGLVPFVEVKKEVLSDNEQEMEKSKPQTEKLATAQTNPSAETQKPTNTTEIQTPQPPLHPSDSVAKEPATNNTTITSPALNTSDKDTSTNPPITTQVKEEVFSDEEDSSAAPNYSKLSIKPTTSTSNENQNVLSKTLEVRVVGDTTIQKLSCKQPSSVFNIPSTTITAQNISSKRTTLRGIPYGPLPASAFPKTIASKTFQQNELVTLQPRAKKTFPQQSPPMEKIRITGATVQTLSQQQQNQQSTSAQIISNSTSTTNSHLDPKKSMAKTTMVAIPVDVASQKTSTCVGTIIGSIPVPPLTAVSKTIPHSSCSINSMVRNTPNTFIVSTSSSSLTTATVMPQTKASTTASLTSTTTVRMSPITMASTMVPTSSSSSSPAQIQQQTTTINPLNMSTPPPLAGLSNSTLGNTQQQQNGILDSNPSTPSSSSGIVPSSAASQPCSTDTHLLGGLVTPTLASAITDVICRGPPKLAARPGGPLQSEGHPMFPSQAGPVCKRLVENVHKLTDFFISVVEDTMGEMAQGDDASLQAKLTLLTMELERSKQAHEQEITELKRTSDLMLCEMRKSMENEKTRIAIEIRKQCEAERTRSVEETKRKQWCANCFREANFYCCWNTSYCDYPCQQLHWSRHAHSCAQTRPTSGSNDLINTSTNSPSTTTIGSFNNLNQQHEQRHHVTKSNSNSSTNLNPSTSFIKSTPTTITKKEKVGVVTKNTSNIVVPTSLSAAATTSASRTNTEVLKLPSNTYLRPVTSTSLNNQTLRCNTTYSIPVQRYNVPEKKIKKKCVTGPWQQTNLYTLPNPKFIKYFLLKIEAFQCVLAEIATKLSESSKISKQMKLAVTMIILGRGSYQKPEDDDIYMPVSALEAYSAFKECIDLIYSEICPKWISFKMTEKEEFESKLHFYGESKFPGIIGCITNVHIQIAESEIHERAKYLNSQKKCSINAMMVFDFKRRIRYISPHNPGSKDDAIIWHGSELRQALSRNFTRNKNTWLLGDLNYPLEHCLMTPFRSAAPESLQSRYNLAHSKARDWLVTQTVSYLKQRFQCLNDTLSYPPEMCGKIIAVCAALHNICISYNMEFPELEFELQNVRLTPAKKPDETSIGLKIRLDVMNNIQKD